MRHLLTVLQCWKYAASSLEGWCVLSTFWLPLGEMGKSQPAGNVSQDRVQLSNQACIQDLAFFKENWSLLSLIGKVDFTVVSWLQGTNLLLFWFNEAQPCSGPLS